MFDRDRDNRRDDERDEDDVMEEDRGASTASGRTGSPKNTENPGGGGRNQSRSGSRSGSTSQMKK